MKLRLRLLFIIALPVLLGFIDPTGHSSVAAAAGSNSAPTISGKPAASITVGKNYYFKPRARDSNGDKLTFSISNKPGWAKFSKSNGKLNGRPANGDVGETSNIVITVSDGKRNKSLRAFSISVTEGSGSTNSDLTISGQPDSSVQVGTRYFFKPATQNPQGGKLTYSIENKPLWAKFRKYTGKLLGTPSANDWGIHDKISISVTNGSSSYSLPDFSIQVNGENETSAPPTTGQLGTITLSWTPPTDNTDGTPLQDLAGYKIYYGASSGEYPNVITIDNPGLTTYVVDNIAEDTYYLVLTSVNRNGVESNFSNETVRKTGTSR